MTTLQDKTPEELNVICAELLGWTDVRHDPTWRDGRPLSGHIGDRGLRQAVPNYTGSWDAIMPCVRALTDKQTFAFIEHLRVIRNIQATGDFAFTWLMMTSSEADLTRALILTKQTNEETK